MDIFQPLILGNDKNPSMFLLIPINFDVLVFVEEILIYIYDLDIDIHTYNIYLNRRESFLYRDIIVLLYIFPICVMHILYGNFHFRQFYKSFVLFEEKLKTPQAVETQNCQLKMVVLYR